MNTLYRQNDKVSTPDEAITHSAQKLGPQAKNHLTSLAGRIAGTGVNVLTGNPVASSAVGSATTAGLRGGRAADVVEAGVRGGANTLAYNALSPILGSAAAPAVGLANVAGDYVAGRDVDLASAAAGMGGSFLGSVLGGALLPGIGPVVGGIAGAETLGSYREGWIGDAFDSRRQEGLRDYGEDIGFTRGETSRMRSDAIRDGKNPEVGLKGVFGDVAYDKTGQPVKSEIDRAIDEAMSDNSNDSRGESSSEAFGDRESSRGGRGGV